MLIGSTNCCKDLSKTSREADAVGVVWRKKKKKEFFGLSITYEFYELFKERFYTLKLICLPSSATPNCLHPGQAGSGTILGRLHGLTCLNLLLA